MKVKFENDWKKKCDRRAAFECGRDSYGFEVDREFYTAAKVKMIDPLFRDPEFKQLKLEG